MLSGAIDDNDYELIDRLLKELDKNEIIFKDAITWGFDFPISLSHYNSDKGAPSVIISLFVYYSLISYYKINKTKEIKSKIENFWHLINFNLPKKETADQISYSYVFDRYISVLNCSAKIGKFLSLCEQVEIGKDNLIKINGVLNHLYINQRQDGSWPYSDLSNYSDSFHTAFILDAIFHMLPFSNDDKHKEMYIRGNKNYFSHFFSNKNQPYYYHPNYLPNDIRKYLTQTDIRDCAMAINLSLLENNMSKAVSVLNWTIDNMYCKKGHFSHYYEYFWKNKICYIRPQAWMYLSFVKIINHNKIDYI